MGPAWSEASLIGFAYAYEQRTNWRSQIDPYIVPTAELKDFVGNANEKRPWYPQPDPYMMPTAELKDSVGNAKSRQ